MKKRLLFGLLVTLLVSLSVTGCSSSDKETAKKKIKVGVTSISEVTYNAIKADFQAMGYESDIVMFDSNPVVLEACNSGEVDIALGQHLKYVQSFNKSKGADLDMAKPYGYYTGIGLYSEKFKSTSEIPDGAKIAIMNDAMNMDIALKILESEGLIKLNPEISTYTVADIVDNPKKLQIIDLDQAQTVTALKDMDAACVFFTHMANAKKDPASYIARDNQMINYPLGVIVKKANVDSKCATDFAKFFRDKKIQDTINSAFPGVFTFYTDDSQVNLK